MNQYMDIEAEKEKFFDVIRSSHVFSRFENAKALIRGCEDKKALIDAFRAQAYELSNSAEPLDHMDEMEELFNIRRRIRKDPLIDEYLTAEHEYCRMIQRICAEMMALSDVQIEAFEDRIRVR